MVAGVFLGSRPTGGYALEVTAVERDGTDLVVVYREGRPDPREMVTQMITSPFHLVRVDRQESAGTSGVRFSGCAEQPLCGAVNCEP